MAIAGTQIALSVLQLVALSLPVFALLAQVYFTVSDDRPAVPMTLIIAFGGGFLVLAGMLSAQFLYINTESFLIQTSVAFVILGLFLILVVLKKIYEKSKEKMRTSGEETIAEAEQIIQIMEEHDFETISEFEESDVTLEDLEEDREPDDIEDLRSQKKDAEKAIDDLETPIWDVLEDSNSDIVLMLTLVISFAIYISPIPFTEPLFVIYPLIASQMIVIVLEWVGVLE